MATHTAGTLAARIDGARSGQEMNEIAADAARTEIDRQTLVRLQWHFASRCRELWPASFSRRRRS